MGWVQTASATGGFPSVSPTFSTATTSGNLIVVAISDDSGTATEVASVTDNASPANTYDQIGTPTQSGTGPTLSLYYAQNITGRSGHQVTVNLNGGSSHCGVVTQEFSSIVASGALDVHTASSGSSTAPASGSTSTTTQASELVIGAVAFGGASGAATLGSGYSNLGSAQVSPANAGMESKTVSATGTQSAGFTIASANWACAVATFKQVVSGGGGTPPTPAIPTFVNSTVYHAVDLNALGSNLTNLYNFTMGGFRTYKPITVIRVTGTVSVPNTGYTVLQFDTADFSSDGMFDSFIAYQSSPSMFITVRTPGVYRLLLQYTMGAPGVAVNALNEAHICINGTSVATNAVSGTMINGRATSSFATVALTTGSQIYGLVAQSTSGAQNVSLTYGGNSLVAQWISP